MKHSLDFDKFKKEILSDGRIVYTYDNWRVFTLPIPGFVSVVCLAVLRLPGDGVQLAPGLPSLAWLILRFSFLENFS